MLVSRNERQNLTKLVIADPLYHQQMFGATKGAMFLSIPNDSLSKHFADAW